MINKNLKNFFPILIILILTFSLVATFAVAASDSVNVSLEVTGGGGGDGGGGGGGGGGEEPPSEIPGCKNSEALNYNVLATIDDGSCTYPPEMMGCTDRTALNYDPTAVGDDGSCLYRAVVPNVSDFQSSYDLEQNKVYLTWIRPVFSQFKTVRIVRSSLGVPANPQDGMVIYEGGANSTVDEVVQTRVRYYYTAFVQNLADEYSSGAVTSVIGLHQDEEEPPLATSTEDGLPISSGVGGDPFAILPMATATDPELVKLSVGDFILRQVGELTKYFGLGSKVVINGEKELILEIDKSALPAVLKTIGVVISDPTKPSRSFSFIMTDNGQGRYSAALSPFLRNGIFPITFYVINYKDQTVKRVSGRLQVAGVSFLSGSAVMAGIQKYADPTATAIGLGVGLTQIAIFGSSANTIYDVYLLLIRLLYSFLSWLGIRRKRPEWGTVYDSVTKQPIDPAYVTVSNVAGQEVTSAITDIDGRFGFLLPKNVYYIKVGKTNYRFPSENLKGKVADELYDSLYFGSPLAHDGNQIIKLNVPLDPVSFDWNEFAKSKINFFQIYTKKETLRRRILAGVFYSGFGVSAINMIITPSVLDLLLLAIYVGIFVYHRILVIKHKIVAVHRSSGEPLPYALIRLYLSGIDQPIKSTTTDALGRFYILVRPGVYYLTVEEKQLDGSYKKVYQSENLNLPKGVLDNDFIV